eukprot:6320046-Amphidinium_carterae.1
MMEKPDSIIVLYIHIRLRALYVYGCHRSYSCKASRGAGPGVWWHLHAMFLIGSKDTEEEGKGSEEAFGHLVLRKWSDRVKMFDRSLSDVEVLCGKRTEPAEHGTLYFVSQACGGVDLCRH